MSLRVILALSLSFFVTGIGAAEKRYPLDRGMLVLAVPDAWVEEVKQDSRTGARTISYSPGVGKQVQVMITPYWPKRGRPPVNKDLARENTERSMEEIKGQTVEKQIPILEFKGKAGIGYYFDATDKAPKPGEFKSSARGRS